MYLRAKVNSTLYPTSSISISEGRAEVSVEIGDDYFHALNAVHGSVYFKLLDDAAFFAVNSIVTEFFVLTTSFNLNLIRPVSSGKLTASGQVRFNLSSIILHDSDRL